jgi:hypothetical protein
MKPGVGTITGAIVAKVEAGQQRVGARAPMWEPQPPRLLWPSCDDGHRPDPVDGAGGAPSKGAGSVNAGWLLLPERAVPATRAPSSSNLTGFGPSLQGADYRFARSDRRTSFRSTRTQWDWPRGGNLATNLSHPDTHDQGCPLSCHQHACSLYLRKAKQTTSTMCITSLNQGLISGRSPKKQQPETRYQRLR